MALVLSMRVGHDLFVGDSRVVVSWVESPYKFGLKKEDGSTLVVTDNEWTPLLAGVKVQAGTPRNQESSKIVRLSIDAPGVRVMRGPLYRKMNSEKVCETCKGRKELTSAVECDKCQGHGCPSCKGTGKVKLSFKCPDCGEE